jgi:hypothetical protein
MPASIHLRISIHPLAGIHPSASINPQATAYHLVDPDLRNQCLTL